MTSSAGEQEYTSAVYADAVWLATTQGSNRITAASSANSTTGSWKASTLYPFTALNSSAAGSTLTGSFTGNIFYAELAATTAAGESVSIAIDGAPPATYSPPPLDYIGVRINYGPYFIRIPLTGANSSTHSVRFTCIAPGPNGCEVVWFAGNGLTNLSAPPYLWLATPYFTAQPGYPQSEYIQMAQIVRNIQAQLSADGLPVFLADLANTFNGVTNSACMADEVHPSDCGHAILAATFINAMNRLLVTSTRSLAYASLAAAANPIASGQNATLTATVTAGYGVPTGSVSFYSGSLLLARQPLVSGAASYTASTATLPAGMYPVTAAYSGDSNYDPATSEPYNITISRAATSTTVNASPATVTPPSSTMLTAQVARTAGSGTPTGTVTFYSATLPIGSATLNANGTATLSAATNGIPSGTYPVTAKYSGDNSDSPSTSASVKVTVK